MHEQRRLRRHIRELMRGASQDGPTHKSRHLRKQNSENLQMERKNIEVPKQHSTHSLTEGDADIKMEPYNSLSHN